MDPITSALFVGAGLLTSVYGNRNKARMEAANTKLQVEQSKLQASEIALQRTKNYRVNTSNALALSGMGFGSTTSLATAAAESFGNYVQDIAALTLQTQFAEAQGFASRSLSRAGALSDDISAIESATSLASKLGLFTPPSKSKRAK